MEKLTTLRLYFSQFRWPHACRWSD